MKFSIKLKLILNLHYENNDAVITHQLMLIVIIICYSFPKGILVGQYKCYEDTILRLL